MTGFAVDRSHNNQALRVPMAVCVGGCLRLGWRALLAWCPGQHTGSGDVSLTRAEAATADARALQCPLSLSSQKAAVCSNSSSQGVPGHASALGLDREELPRCLAEAKLWCLAALWWRNAHAELDGLAAELGLRARQDGGWLAGWLIPYRFD